MQNLNHKIIFSLLTCLVILTGCSDDKSQQSSKVDNITFDHPHSGVSDLKKHTFEHKFAAQCVAREIRHSVNKTHDRKRFEKSCMCIATRIMKNLTAVEAEKFLQEKKSTQSLRMSFDEAAYFCLQKNVKPKVKVLFDKK